jgi:hypothetical protein
MARGPNRIRRRPPHHSGSVQPAATAGLLAPRYPGGFDVKPTLADDATVLSSILLNFIGAIVEAVEAEVGPLANNGKDKSKWVAGEASLLELLDVLNVQTPTYKGFVGLRRFIVTKLHSLFAGLSSTVVSVAHRTPNSTFPVFFSTVNQGSNTNAQMGTGATTVAGDSNWLGPASISLQYRGVAGDGTGQPTGGTNVTMDAILISMPVGTG